MRNVCDTREAWQWRRWPPKQLEGVLGVYEQAKAETAGGEGRRRGCVSISLGTVILQRLPKLKRLDCFQRMRMAEEEKDGNGGSYRSERERTLVRRGTNTFLVRHLPRAATVLLVAA